MKHNIVLIGFMGCGKTTIGKVLAQELGYTFTDTDACIEESAKKTISEIFAAQGEEYFRNLETETVNELMETTDYAVISTGGGLPLRKVNADILKKNGFVVYLKVQGETVEQRLKGDTTRPLLQGENVSEKIKSMLEFRDPMYEFGAHMVLEADEKPVKDLAEEIRRNYLLMHGQEMEETEGTEGRNCIETDH